MNGPCTFFIRTRCTFFIRTNYITLRLRITKLCTALYILAKTFILEDGSLISIKLDVLEDKENVCNWQPLAHHHNKKPGNNELMRFFFFWK